MLALRPCLNVKIYFDIEPNMQISLSSEYESERAAAWREEGRAKTSSKLMSPQFILL